MTRVDDYGLREFIGGDTLSREQERIRFERTQKALNDWRSEGGKGALGDFYAWLADSPTGPSTIAREA